MRYDEPTPSLPLGPLDPRLPFGAPFTPAMARGVGVPRSTIDRMHRDGLLRRVLRGVYVDATAADSTPTRAAALALVMPGHAVAAGRTAAWLHGVEVCRGGTRLVPPVELLGGPSAGRTAPFHAMQVPLAADLEVLAGVRVTTPLRTALDLGRLLAPDRALAALDALLRTGRFDHRDLLAQVDRFRDQRGAVQLRKLAPMGDARSQDAAESFLRLRWLEANLPTPVPQLRVVTGHGWCRLTLGVEGQRFAVVLPDRITDADREWLAGHRWRVVVVSRERVLGSDPLLVMGHLEREFHQHLLGRLR